MAVLHRRGPQCEPDTYERWAMSAGIRALGYERWTRWAMSAGLRALGYEHWAMSAGLRALSYERWAIGALGYRSAGL
eukprot:1144804-Pelagomonas_calceolata.AAC.1